MVLRDPPDYAVAERYPDMNQTFHQTFGYDVPEEVHEHFREIESGVPPSKPGGEAWVPTLFDSSQGPGGHHTAGFWQFVPWDVEGRGPGYWDEIKDEYFDHILSRWAEYAPNMTQDNVVHRFSYTPIDNAGGPHQHGARRRPHGELQQWPGRHGKAAVPDAGRGPLHVRLVLPSRRLDHVRLPVTTRPT